jgi:acetoin utilization protein AcuC
MTGPRLTVVWDERFRAYDFGAGHPFQMSSRGLAARLLERTLPDDGTVDWIREVAPASAAELATFHTAEYLSLVKRSSSAERPVFLDAGDTPAFPGCWEAAARVVGGTRRGVDLARERNAPVFQPGGGLHHAHPDRASGFCIFNDVALGVRHALDAGDRVAYVDIDAHHGDGVMYGFFDTGRLLDIDFHQDGRTLFPGTGFPSETGEGDGDGAKVNLPLPPGTGDEALVPLFRRVAVPLLREFHPDLIVLQHGMDGHVGDLLAGLQYTPDGYVALLDDLRDLSRELCRSRLLVTGGGGYTPENVARGLARAGRRLVGSVTDPGPDDPLPALWREEFQRVTGEAAPRDWSIPTFRAPSPWNPGAEEQLVGDLESALGRRFPRPRDQS